MIGQLLKVAKNVYNKLMKDKLERNEQEKLRLQLINKIKKNIIRYTNIQTLPAGSKDYYYVYKTLERYIQDKDDLILTFSIIKDMIDRLLFKIKVCRNKSNDEIISQLIFVNDFEDNDYTNNKEEKDRYIEGFRHHFL